MKVLLIVNPSASSVTARTRIVIQKALSADHRLEVAATTRRGHATRLAQSASNDGMDVVVVLGGDGTLNEAANGLAGTDTALAALPGGSTNVFARTIGLPDDAVEATGALLDAIEAASIRRVALAPLATGTSCSTPASASTPRWSSRCSGAVACSSGSPAIPCSSPPPSTRGSATTTIDARCSGWLVDASTSRVRQIRPQGSRACSPCASTRTPTHTWVPGAYPWFPRRRWTAHWPSSPSGHSHQAGSFRR